MAQIFAKIAFQASFEEKGFSASGDNTGRFWAKLPLGGSGDLQTSTAGRA
jgi:hypothetical protein